MKQLFYLLLVSTVVMLKPEGVIAQANKNIADKILGIYWSPAKDAKIEIYKKGQQYFGKVIWSSTLRTDAKNPDQKLRNRNMLGTDLLTGFSYDDGTYTGGDIYDPGNGKTYSCKISFTGVNLKVRGYIGISLFGRTEIFERVIAI